MNTILTMSSFIFPLITFPYVSRILLPGGTGKVSFATSVVAYFSMFAQLGIPTYGIRACAQAREDKQELSKTVHEILSINLLTTTISYIVFFVVINTFARFNEDKTLYVIISFTMFFQALGMEWLYKGLEKYSYITIRSLIFKVVALIGMFLLVHEQSDYVIYGAISVFASSASNIFNLVHSHRYIMYRRLGAYNYKRHLKPIIVFFAMACATAIYVHLDTVMLGLIKTDIDVGYYNAAVKIRTVLLTVVTSLGTVLLPRASYYFKHNHIEQFNRITNRAMHFTLLLGFPVTVYFMIFAKEGIMFLSGPAYDGSIIPMTIIMPTVLLAGISNITGIEVLIPQGKEKVVLYSEIAGAVTDLMLNMVMIPKLGCTGAAIGTTIAEVVVLGYQTIHLKTLNSNLYNLRWLKNILIGIGVAAICSYWIRELAISPFITLVVSGLLFFLAYGICMVILKDDLIIEIMEGILKKVRRKK